MTSKPLVRTSRPFGRATRLTLLSCWLALGCDALLTNLPEDQNVLAGPIDGLSGPQLTQHVRGDEEFGRTFAVGDGLGPIFIAAACERCHPGDGKGHPVFSLTRFGRATALGFDPMRGMGGPQLQHRAIPRYTAEVVPGEATGVARLLAPAVTGLGYLEAVSDQTLLDLEDPEDLDGDGVSGRVQLVDESDVVIEIDRLEAVLDGATSARQRIANQYVGRFGRKAAAISLLHQTVTAYQQDMGLSTDILPFDPVNLQVGGFTGDDVPEPEVPSSTVQAVVFYLRTLRTPPRRGPEAADVVAGEGLFSSVGCAKCHLPTLRTGPSSLAALSNLEFHPYTDLLLHDMGPELDDGYTEGRAFTSEWRTTPLWGLGLADRSQGGEAFYLHDGRARTLRQAIELHGGEGAGSRTAFRALSPSQQEQLLAFLRSL
ncbi:MAG TPA: di-heme oxidoredictase family protein [Gemmatimonadales bacterium]